MSSNDLQIPALPGLELLGLIGRGGVADVFEAVRTDAKGERRRVAVKRLAVDRELPAKAVERFAEEARTIARLSHPGVVRMEDVLVADGQQYLIMEMLEGESVADLSAGPAVPEWVAIGMAVQALEALVYVHTWRGEEGGLVHRDLTPGNLFLCTDGVVKLLDFGVAKKTARQQLSELQELTQVGMVVGTIGFLSPEQARGEGLDGRSDLFQLAGTLWYLLTGESPYGRGNAAQLFDRALKGGPIALRSRREGIDPELLRLFERALQADRSQRFADAAEMLEAARALATRHPRATAVGLSRWMAEKDGEAEQRNHTVQLAPVAETRVGGIAEKSRPLRAGERLGRYLILHPIGQGGMGEVLAAYDPELERKVAIKLVRARAVQGRSASEGQARLLREAQAMARVSHPNVIPVFDVGTFDDRVFIAMELVEGGTLRDWLRQKSPGWREVTATLRDAGRGLAAAHQAGLVHRDFKPDNILIGKDGRARVTDFGLARSALSKPDRIGGKKRDPELALAMGTCTSTGSGTPAYMAPEQHAGQAADARSDQYSFCASLFEALYKRRWREVNAKLASGQNKQVQAELAECGVPTWLGRVVRRGLSEDPAARYPSLTELIDELGRDPAVQRRRWLGSAAVVLTAVVAALGARQLGDHERMMCRGADQKLVGVWDSGVKAVARRAFMATGRSYAAETWRLTEKIIDNYIHDWSAMRTDACEATRVRGDQSEEVMSLRMVCLDQALTDVAALGKVLARADGRVLDKAAQAAAGLPHLSACADVAALKAVVRLPDDPHKRAQIEKLSQTLATVRAEQRTGQLREAMALVEPVPKQAAALGYRPLETQANWVRGILYAKLGDNKRAEADLRRSVTAAVAAGATRDEAWAYVQLTFLVGYVEGRYEEAEWYNDLAKAALERVRGAEEVESWRLNAEAAIASNRGDNAKSVALFRQAVATSERVPEKERENLGTLVSNEAEALIKLGHYAEAEKIIKRAVGITERTLGAQHPELSYPLSQMAQVLLEEGRSAAALPFAERSLAIREQGGAPGQAVADSLEAVARCHMVAGRSALAGPLLERARALRQHEQGTHHPEYGQNLVLEAELQNATGKPKAAIATYREAAAIIERAQGPEGVGLVRVLAGTGESLLALGDVKGALTTLERATRLAEARSAPPRETAEAFFGLAQVRWRLPGERAGVKAALERATLAAKQALNDSLAETIARWAAQHQT